MTTYHYTLTLRFEAKNLESARKKADAVDQRAQNREVTKTGEARLKGQNGEGRKP